MSETPGVGRRFTRIKERFLQTFGKSGKTVDENFDECVRKFLEHHGNVSRYEKMVKAYYSAMKSMRNSNRQLMDTMWDIYDPTWVDSDKVQLKIGMLEQNFDKLVKEFKSNVVIPIHRYVGRMNDLSARISKREEKRLDYDASRRNLDKVKNSDKQDQEKLDVAERDFGEVRRQYEEINEELIEELPQFNDARVYFLGLILNSFSQEEYRFHSEASVLYGHLLQHTQSLNKSVVDESLMEYIYKEERKSLSGLSIFSRSSSTTSSPDISDAENPVDPSTSGQDESNSSLNAKEGAT